MRICLFDTFISRNIIGKNSIFVLVDEIGKEHVKSVVFSRVNETIIEQFAIHCCVVILLDQSMLIVTEKKEVSNRQKILINPRGFNYQLFVNKKQK